MIKRFEKTTGRYIEKICGQDRLAYAHTDSSDLFDLVEWAERGGYPGSVILFYDFTNGKVYKPFRKKKNTAYANPAYANGYYWILQGDYGKKKVTLYRYLPGERPEAVTEFGTDGVKLYNLQIIGSPVYVISQDTESAECYYPVHFTIQKEPIQSLALIEENKVYLEEWVEEGWDDENDRATEDYRFYTRIVVKDWQGNELSREIGAIFQSPDGSYWIS